MQTAEDLPNEDTTDRVEELTGTWESSPLTDPEEAADPAAKSPVDPGYIQNTDAADGPASS